MKKNKHKRLTERVRAALMREGETIKGFARKHGLDYYRFIRFISGDFTRDCDYHQDYVDIIKSEIGIDVLKERGMSVHSEKPKRELTPKEKVFIDEVDRISRQEELPHSIELHPNFIEDYLVDITKVIYPDDSGDEDGGDSVKQDEASYKSNEEILINNDWHISISKDLSILHVTSKNVDSTFKVCVANPHDEGETLCVMYGSNGDMVEVIYNGDFSCFKKGRNLLKVAQGCKYIPSRDNEYYIVVTPEIRVSVDVDKKRMIISGTTSTQEASAFGGDEWHGFGEG